MTGTGGSTPARGANRRDANPQAPASDWALQIIAGGVIVAVLYWARIVFISAFAAVIIALILEPFVRLLGKLRVPRPIATFAVCVVALLILYFGALTAWSQVSSIVSDVPALKQNLTALVEGVSGRIQRVEDSVGGILNAARKAAVPASLPGLPAANAPAVKKSRKTPPAPAPQNQNPPPGFIPEVRIHEDNPVSAIIYAQLGTLYQYAVMASFVPLLVYFMLSWRDHIYRSFLRFFDGPTRLTAARSVQGIAEMARAFVVGNFLIGVVLAVLSSVFFAIIHLPYPFLTGFLSGFLSLVPTRESFWRCCLRCLRPSRQGRRTAW